MNDFVTFDQFNTSLLNEIMMLMIIMLMITCLFHVIIMISKQDTF